MAETPSVEETVVRYTRYVVNPARAPSGVLEHGFNVDAVLQERLR